jgi:hypothetical protein
MWCSSCQLLSLIAFVVLFLALCVQVAAPLEVIGHAADKLMLRKPTHIGENHLYIGMAICTMFYYLM